LAKKKTYIFLNFFFFGVLVPHREREGKKLPLNPRGGGGGGGSGDGAVG